MIREKKVKAKGAIGISETLEEIKNTLNKPNYHPAPSTAASLIK
jgi:hypothetical protein